MELETHVFPVMAKFAPVVAPIFIAEDTYRVVVFIVVALVKLRAVILVVVSALEAYMFPWTLRALAVGAVPIPIFDATTSEKTF
jgi:hypothetical protein